MRTFEYIKINGAGNDFVLIDQKQNPDLNLAPLEIAKICDREKGIGADGLIFIKDDKDTDFVMDYFNSDGSTGSLCGNGARCAIKYADFSTRVKNRSTTFISNGIQYSGEIISDDTIRFHLIPPKKIKTNFRVKAHNQMITAHYADTGSPHVIINIADVLSNPKRINSSYQKVEDFPVAEVGKEIRNLPEFIPGGANANFIQLEKDQIKIRSYERGVEHETLACGTGAVAAAIISNIIYKKNPPIKFITKSNAELIVNFDTEKNEFHNLSLTGPVEIEKSGTYSI